MNERRNSPMVKLPPVTMEKLLGRVPDRSDFDRVDGYIEDTNTIKRIYTRLARQDLQPYILQGEQSTNFIVCGPRVHGLDLNAMLFLIAGYKNFGLDTEDIIQDWSKLFEDPRYFRRLEAHSKMLGWDIFAKNRVALGSSISSYNERRKRQVNTSLIGDKIKGLVGSYRRRERFIPVFNWRRDEEGKRSWEFDLSDESRQQLIQIYGKQVVDEHRLNSLVGLLFVASYSPGITEGWPEYANYSGKEAEDGREIGPTQSLQMLLMKQNGLVRQSLVLKAIERYSDNPKGYKANSRRYFGNKGL